MTVLVEYLKDERIPELLDSAKFDFVVDAIDTVAPKCYLIYNVLQRRLPIVSSMGAGAKWDITQVRFADLWDTYHCGLSKAVRKRLQKMGMKRKLPVVFSTEQAGLQRTFRYRSVSNPYTQGRRIHERKAVDT